MRTILLRKRCHHEPTMALTLDDDDRQEFVLYIYLYVYTHRAQLFTVNYLLSTTYDSVCCIYTYT